MGTVRILLAVVFFLCHTVQAATRHNTLLLPAQAVVISSAKNSRIEFPRNVPPDVYSTFGRVVCRPDGTVGLSKSTTVHYFLNDAKTLLETGTDIYLCPDPVTKEELYCIYCHPGLKTHRIAHKNTLLKGGGKTRHPGDLPDLLWPQQGVRVNSGKPLSGKSTATSSERWKITESGAYADSMFNVPLYLYQISGPRGYWTTGHDGKITLRPEDEKGRNDTLFIYSIPPGAAVSKDPSRDDAEAMKHFHEIDGELEQSDEEAGAEATKKSTASSQTPIELIDPDKLETLFIRGSPVDDPADDIAILSALAAQPLPRLVELRVILRAHHAALLFRLLGCCPGLESVDFMLARMDHWIESLPQQLPDTTVPLLKFFAGSPALVRLFVHKRPVVEVVESSWGNFPAEPDPLAKTLRFLQDSLCGSVALQRLTLTEELLTMHLPKVFTAITSFFPDLCEVRMALRDIAPDSVQGSDSEYDIDDDLDSQEEDEQVGNRLVELRDGSVEYARSQEDLELDFIVTTETMGFTRYQDRSELPVVPAPAPVIYLPGYMYASGARAPVFGDLPVAGALTIGHTQVIMDLISKNEIPFPPHLEAILVLEQLCRALRKIKLDTQHSWVRARHLWTQTTHIYTWTNGTAERTEPVQIVSQVWNADGTRRGDDSDYVANIRHTALTHEYSFPTENTAIDKQCYKITAAFPFEMSDFFLCLGLVGGDAGSEFRGPCFKAAMATNSLAVSYMWGSTILVSAVLPAAAALFTHAPLNARRHPMLNDRAGSNSGGATLAAINTSTLANLGDIRYTTNITINGQSFRVAVDTGSSDLWYAKSVSQNPGAGDLLDPGINGLIGVAFDIFKASTLKNTLDDSGMYGRGEPFLFNLFKKTPQQDNFIGMSLSRSDDREGTSEASFTVNEVDETYADIVSTPSLPLFPGTGRWSILIDGISVDNVPVSIPKSTIPVATSGKIAVVMDSGTPTGLLPQDLFNAIYSAIPGATPYKNGAWLIPCNTTTIVRIEIGGAQFPIHPLDLSEYTTDPDTDRTGCFSSLNPAPAEGDFDGIFGDTITSVTPGASTTNTGNTSMQLLPQTDPTAAVADVLNVRMARLSSQSSGAVAAVAAGNTESASHGSNSQVKKYGPIVVGLLGANLLVAVILAAIGVVVCVKRGGKSVKYERGQG
ncbi:hypothetical protein DFH06DRAFT_1324680 [Mycena polygramma]|nr:hypothetical protein DFH06DRAFT_1324680 [Mycena polygramma]